MEKPSISALHKKAPSVRQSYCLAKYDCFQSSGIFFASFMGGYRIRGRWLATLAQTTEA